MSVMFGKSLEGKGSEGEKVFLELWIRRRTSSEEIGGKDENSGGGQGGDISVELVGIIVE